MSKLTEKIPVISALLLVAISILLVALIYVGGDVDSVNFTGEPLAVPRFTNALLYWTYFLMILAVSTTLLLAALAYIKNFRHHPKAALRSLLPFALFLMLFIITWRFGSGEKMTIIGYEGVENQGFWAQFSDAIIYATYALFATIVLVIIGSRIYVRMK